RLQPSGCHSLPIQTFFRIAPSFHSHGGHLFLPSFLRHIPCHTPGGYPRDQARIPERPLLRSAGQASALSLRLYPFGVPAVIPGYTCHGATLS
ncbi:MAG TPA: hypothetical protein PLY13_03740, partial [Methanoregulaceae archaeon]|nr:hypothetical protein [Methanoregulaceae archaeon]